MGSEHIKDRHELTAQGAIRKSRLRRNQYTISLMNEGLRAGMLTSQEIMRIQHGFIQILQELLQKYTQGESTSVATETAESILASITYAADAYLISFEEPEKAITYLKAIDVRRIYDKGVEKVSQCFAETKQLYKEISANKLEVPVDAYNLTIDESLPVFFRKYGIIFDAHNTMASIDYPLAIDDMRLQGVFYIKQYLERLKLETEFCAMFDRQHLLDLLVHYGRECRLNYRIELFNIYELMLNNAIFSILSGGDAYSIRISGNQFARLEQQFMSLEEGRIRSVISDAMERLQQEMALHSQLMEYMDGCKEDLVQRVANAAKHGSLRTVIITEREAEAKSMVISFNEEDRMSDVQLRRRLHEIMACERKEVKAKLILSSFHSFHDYLDMLESDCLYGDEYDALFQAFGDMELAILATIVFYEELRGMPPDLPSFLLAEKEYPLEWHLQLVQCLRGMSRERLQTVEAYMHEMDYEPMKFY
ncbi:DUF6179 domain-containing protein [Paenibacillus melissococcoides]|uniref:DUF6179 domain-containing protein n=1 Tax=Paenibacillus melissococcoides TaxID=2912268 RepID=A0ABM9G5X3_9BACL|nr:MULTISPECIES: DUF6179 domain-containing protein [Paenibacillus]MEB9894085.1 DUF6179 domain-containing protein [Bacillus cereus]CAH8247209.1 DUF6179 domain-containing protein [Paenibacillus melissococcoides]CAH8717034.1 DUF6179 domain-containing protein [Paenibacillus melissococcoides]CAH8718016.1 DUF6179 domain-containing protein [Paenibacillus melissococcoides]GIO79280.1 hypothetical protein J6TS7_28900 [Paenibacillus dendritiformis]